MIKRLARIGANESGTTAIELGLLAPILGTILVGMIDLSSAYSAKLKLVQGAQRGVEKIQRFGVGAPGKTDAVSLKLEVADGAGVTVDKVTITSWLECTSSAGTVTVVAYDGSCSTGQAFSRNVRIAAQSTYAPMFSMKWAGANDDGTFTLNGEAGIRVQ